MQTRRHWLVQVGLAGGAMLVNGMGYRRVGVCGASQRPSTKSYRPKGPHRCFRQFNLDWSWVALHPEQVGEFLRDSSPSAIADFLANSFVDGTVVMAVPHHGYCTHATRVGTRFPSLTFDWFGQMVEQLHRRNISAFGYVTLNWNWKFIREHLGKDYIHGQPDADGICSNRVLICLNAPGYLDLVQAYTEEVLQQYPVDGMRWDILKTPRGCSCVGCRNLYRQLFGESWDSARPLPEHLQDELHDQTIERVVRRLYECCKRIRPEVDVWQNHFRPYSPNPLHLARLMDIAYNEFGDPFHLLFMRGVSGRSAVINGLMNRAPSDPPQPLNRREWRLSLALGGRCYSYYGHLHTNPRTALPEPAFQRWHREQLAPFYRMVQEIQPWLEDAEPFCDIAVVFCDRTRLRWPKRSRTPYLQHIEPWANLAVANSRPIAFLDAADLPTLDASGKNWALLVAPLTSGLSDQQLDHLKQFVQRGGVLLVAGDALRHDINGKPLPDFALADLMGIHWQNELPQATIRAIEGPWANRLDLSAMPPESLIQAEPAQGQTVLWAVLEDGQRIALLHERRWGQGRFVWLAALRPPTLVFQIVQYLAGPPPLKVTGPADAQAILAHQPSKKRWIIHLLSDGEVHLEWNIQRLPMDSIEAFYPPHGWQPRLVRQTDQAHLAIPEGRSDRLVILRSGES